MKIQLTKPHAAQDQVLREAARFNVLECGRRWGKTQLGVLLVVTGSVRGWPCAWFAPTYKFLLDPWRACLRTLQPIITNANKQEHRIELATGGSIDFWTMDNDDAGRGRKYRRAAIDEGGVVRSLESCWTEAIRPTLTDYAGDAWFFGTPKGHNYFHRLFVRGQNGEKGWRSWRMGTITNPFIPPEEVEAARLDMLPSVFAQEFEGIPADDGGNPFGLSAIAACVMPMSDKPACVYGIDLAKSHDWTVCIGLDQAGCVCSLERWQAPWRDTTKRLERIVGSVQAFADSTGVGDPIVEQLQAALPNVEGFKFTSMSKQQLMEGLAYSIQHGEVGFPDGVVRNELETFAYEFTPGGRVTYSAPDGLHDDCVCALALAVHGFKNRSLPYASWGAAMPARVRTPDAWNWGDD